MHHVSLVGPVARLRFGAHHSLPPTFGHFLEDWLLVAGLPYGPQAREAMAQTFPALFGRAYRHTVRGYERWLARAGLEDSCETFTRFMDQRYRRWVTTA